MSEEETPLQALVSGMKAADDARGLGEFFMEKQELANRVRADWARMVAMKEKTLEELVLFTYEEGAYPRYVLKIKLFDILKQANGWNHERAYEALVNAGLNHDMNVLQLRTSLPVFERFKDLLLMNGNDWMPRQEKAIKRPPMPQGWPWRSKIEDLYELARQHGHVVPVEGSGEMWVDSDGVIVSEAHQDVPEAASGAPEDTSGVIAQPEHVEPPVTPHNEHVEPTEQPEESNTEQERSYNPFIDDGPQENDTEPVAENASVESKPVIWDEIDDGEEADEELETETTEQSEFADELFRSLGL